ncbi:NAD(P)-binding domain-containing protein [Allosalinactinospora lopnorensis]|uniref:hypothetical protein n=1 Tax=Allosalinactinospora lopnorensis TaxID=1352348 RepID=UPI00191C32CD|nr:hypothetical protein [Allosalinactinospora lopnorensis]
MTGAAGKTTIDATNSFSPRPEGFNSLAEYVKSLLGGPTAKSFSLNFGSVYDSVGREQVAPSNLFAADPEARQVTERLNRDAGFDPVYVGDLSKARLIEDQLPVLFLVAQNADGPVFYRYSKPGGLTLRRP